MVAATLGLAFATSLAFAQAGKLDQRFGNHGRVLTHVPGRGFLSVHAAIDKEGRILVTTWHRGESQLLRYLPSGELDLDFGDRGRVTIGFDRLAGVSDVDVDAQNRVIVAGGTPYVEDIPPTTYIARFAADGNLDSSFGNDGVATGDHPFGATAIKIDAADRITVLGDPPPESLGDLKVDPDSVGKFIARFNADGGADTTFRDNAPTLGFRGGTNLLDFTIDPLGRIVIAGEELPGDPEDESVHFNSLVLRLLPDGRLDPSFSGDGRAKPRARRFADSAGGVATDQRGRILLSASNDYTVARLRDDGAVDSSFGHHGRARFAPFAAGPFTGPAGIILDGQGRPIIAGTASYLPSKGPERRYFGFVRTTMNGQIDPAFGRHLSRVGFGQPHCRASCPPTQRRDLLGGTPLVDSAGRLVLVGAAKRGRRIYVALTRVRLP